MAPLLATQADQVDRLGYHLPNLGGRASQHLQSERDILVDGLAGQQPEVLEDGADLATQRRHLPLVQPTEIFAQHEDTAGGGPVLTQDQAEESGLARAGGAHEEDELTPLDLEVDVAKRGLGLTRVDLRHVLECDHVTVLFVVPI